MLLLDKVVEVQWVKKVTSEYLQGCREHGMAVLEIVLLVVSAAEDEGPVSVGYSVLSLEVSLAWEGLLGLDAFQSLDLFAVGRCVCLLLAQSEKDLRVRAILPCSHPPLWALSSW